MVDEVTGVLRVPVTSIKVTPLEITSKVHADYLNGVIVLGEKFLLLLDLPKILSEAELLGFGAAVNQTVEETLKNN
jgi:chemotaxis signal transduction protein